MLSDLSHLDMAPRADDLPLAVAVVPTPWIPVLPTPPGFHLLAVGPSGIPLLLVLLDGARGVFAPLCCSFPRAVKCPTLCQGCGRLNCGGARLPTATGWLSRHKRS